MAINKVIYNNNTLIDLTSDTAEESDVLVGKTFHKADGSSAVGTGTGGTACDMYVGDDTGIQTGDLFIDDVGGTYQSKTLTLGASAPSTVTPDSGYDGLSSVAVALNSSVIKAENIAQGSTILGVQGTHSGGITPSGTISITQNGTVDVTNYASANVSIPTYDGSIS